MSESDSDEEPEVASAKVPTESISSHSTASKKVCYNWIAGRCQKKDCIYLHEGKQRMTKKERKAESDRKRAEQGKNKKDKTKKSLYQRVSIIIIFLDIPLHDANDTTTNVNPNSCAKTIWRKRI